MEPEIPQTASSLDDILKAISDTKKTHITEVWCPSLEKEVQFYPLDASHQKDFIKSMADGPFMVTNFSMSANNMIKSLIADPTINPVKLTKLDKVFILIALRASSICAEYSTEHKNKSEEKFTHKLNLIPHLKRKSGKPQSPPSVIEVDEYKLTLDYPSLAVESQFDSYVYSQSQSLDMENKNSVKTALTLLFVSNLFQYVKTLQIGERFIDFEALGIGHKYQIAGLIPSKIAQEMIRELDKTFIPNLSDITNYAFTKDGVEYEGNIDIDSAFFLTD